MPKHVLDHLHVHSGAQRQGRRTVAETMQSDRRQARQPDQPSELVRDISRVQRTAIGLGEHQVRLDPIGTKPRLRFILASQVGGVAPF
ncbi:hypothetical protein QP939_26620 [Amycolatopsis nalaikhensis]|uniref:Uncharacterized protein n=1 Tax=Amycolatopsis nalaikhensis TaxID=715472 RepID=A0ABY8X962_9PSEU|nr:hypothetical protein [Amycolatopsis sp. 2-2]WIV52541.1 hypothetical protein QP939_26620 [Amycolatopsis sp. 2-2]